MSGETRRVAPQTLLRDPGHCLALGLGSGCAPWAPGTWGTVIGVLLYALLGGVPLSLYIGILVVSFLVGLWLCARTARALGVHDDGAIVWDEFVGVWIALAFQPTQWWWILAAFLAFRVFDILKPWPIGWLDRRVSGGLGIMLDDVVAGLYALAVLVLASAMLLP